MIYLFFTNDLSTSDPDLYEWYLTTLNKHEKDSFFETVIIPNKQYDYISTYNIIPTFHNLLTLAEQKKIDSTILAHCIFAGMDCTDDRLYDYVDEDEVNDIVSTLQSTIKRAKGTR